MLDTDTHVAVIGGGVVGCAVAHALARRGVEVVLLEAELGLALGASGSNSGILHTGFDSTPGELETRLIVRSAELREELLDELGLHALVDLNMRLGEASGAAVALLILRAALACHTGMATFAEAGVSDKPADEAAAPKAAG